MKRLIYRLPVLMIVFIAVVGLYLVLSVPTLSMTYIFSRSTKLFSISKVSSAQDDVLPNENNGSSVRKVAEQLTNRNAKGDQVQQSSNNEIEERNAAAGSGMMLNESIVNVGFFEGFRRAWIYPKLFQPPPSPRMCECYDKKEIRFYVNVTLEKNASQTNIFDVLFFPQDVSTLPYKRSVMDTILTVAKRGQKRIYATFECGGKLKFLALNPPYNRKIFHWSLTYHSKSDFPTPYGCYRLFQQQYRPSGLQVNWAKRKSGLVAWMSTWKSKYWKRSTFVQMLIEHVSVDIFGKTEGRTRCPRNSTECKQKIQQYKFYLALENSCCSEYISEKFWRTLSWDIVPIVVGASRDSYEKFAPPHSFVYADDFETVQDLAQYILILDKNDDLYNQYFRWKEEGEIIVNYPDKKDTPVKSRVPPKGFFYSCNAVCRASNKYLGEKEDPDFNGFVKSNKSSVRSDVFDPNVSWWWNSCVKCGKHDWIRNLN